MVLSDYRAVESLCAELASRLRKVLPVDDRRVLFVPIPRGGMVVLGLLAYQLQLERRQLCTGAASAGSRATVVVVDDCALSGLRFSEALEALEAPRVIFAHLLSPAPLRQAIVQRESRVETCVAAADLEVRRGPGLPSAAQWEAWRQDLPGTRYWLGAVAPVAFPWSEPAQVLWNAREGRFESGWHRVGPRHCFAHRGELALPLLSVELGPLDLAPEVVWRLQEGEILLARPDLDRVVSLGGVAADMLRAVLASGDVEQAAAHLEERYEVPRQQLHEDLEALVADLLHRGLLAVEPVTP